MNNHNASALFYTRVHSKFKFTIAFSSLQKYTFFSKKIILNYYKKLLLKLAVKKLGLDLNTW